MKRNINSYTIAFSSILTAIIVAACSSGSKKGDNATSSNNSSNKPEVASEFIENVQAVTAGGANVFAIKKDGTLWAFGFNSSGQLGLGNNTNSNLAQQVTSFGTDASAVSASLSHTLVIKKDGTLWSFGSNYSGELGLGNNTDISTAQQVTFTDGVNNNVRAVAAGSTNYLQISRGFSLVLKKDGTVWAFGSNKYGQLGLGNNTNASKPTQIPNIANAVAIAVGADHSLILKNDGNVWSMGSGYNSHLGLNTTADINIPTQIPNLKDVKAIAAGYCYSLILDNDNTVWAFGYSRFGQLGLNSTENAKTPTKIDSLTGVKAISAGLTHSLVLIAEGSLWAFGTNNFGQLGLQGNKTFTSTPTMVSSLGKDVSSMSAGGRLYPNSIATYTDFTIALKNDGTLWSFGSNYSGQLGLGTTDDTSIPTQVKQIKSAQ